MAECLLCDIRAYAFQHLLGEPAIMVAISMHRPRSKTFPIQQAFTGSTPIPARKSNMTQPSYHVNCGCKKINITYLFPLRYFIFSFNSDISYSRYLIFSSCFLALSCQAITLRQDGKRHFLSFIFAPDKIDLNLTSHLLVFPALLTECCTPGRNSTAFFSWGFSLVAAVRLERTTDRVWTDCSSQLSYAAINRQDKSLPWLWLVNYSEKYEGCQAFLQRGTDDFSEILSDFIR